MAVTTLGGTRVRVDFLRFLPFQERPFGSKKGAMALRESRRFRKS
jgi:hypothetical protein